MSSPFIGRDVVHIGTQVFIFPLVILDRAFYDNAVLFPFKIDGLLMDRVIFRFPVNMLDKTDKSIFILEGFGFLY